MNIKNLKCKLFKLHDYEIIHRENKEKIIAKIEDEIFYNSDFKKKYSNEILVQKVCLNCGKCVDEIIEFKREYIQNKIDKTKRKKDAIFLFTKK